MAKFDGGVGWYTEAECVIKVFFPENEIKCQYCPWCRSEAELKRYWCRITNGMIYDPYYPALPAGCPLKIKTADGGEVEKFGPRPESNPKSN